MKRVISTMAVTLMLSGSALAESQMTKFDGYTFQENHIRASQFIGKRIYASETEMDEGTTVRAGTEKEWDDIGEINDVIFAEDGSIKAVVLGIGGFIGIGEKDVAVQMDKIRFVSEEGESGEYFLVVKTNKETLESAPELQWGTEQQAAMENKSSDAEGKTVEAQKAEMKNSEKETEKTAMNDERSNRDRVTTSAVENGSERIPLVRPDVARDGYQEAKIEELTAENFLGARVYGANEESVGEVENLIFDDNGQIREVVLDIGGFLGMGEHRIAVTYDEIKVLRDADWGNVRVYIDSTQSALENQPEYKG